MDIKDLKKLRSQMSFDSIASSFEKEMNPAQSNQDDRFWKPERDKAGNATATIRFLSSPIPDQLPFVKIFSHAFKGPTGRWYIENSLTTLNQPDPLSEYNSQLWNSTTDDNSPERNQAREQKRKLNYISEILVINDPKHPENNGKVFFFKYGKKIFEKIHDKGKPAFEDIKPVNVFDYWEGANFNLRIKTVSKFPNYDQSTFDEPSSIGTDEDILEVVNKQRGLKEFLSESNFKSYDQLKAKLNMVLGDSGKEVSQKPKPKPIPVEKEEDEDDDPDMLQFFKNLNDE